MNRRLAGSLLPAGLFEGTGDLLPDLAQLAPIFTKRIGPQSGSVVLIAERPAFPPGDGDRVGQAGLAQDW